MSVMKDIRYLNSMVFDHKENILSQHFLEITPKIIGMKYCLDIVIRAIEYSSKLWPLYNRLRQDFLLMSSKFQNLKNLFCYRYFIFIMPIKKGVEFSMKKSVNNPSLFTQPIIKQYVLMGIQNFFQDWFQFINQYQYFYLNKLSKHFRPLSLY